MWLWGVSIDIVQPCADLPAVFGVASERHDSPAYHCEGRHRPTQEFCVFAYTLAGEGRFRDAQGEYVVGTGSGFLCEVCDPATAYYYPARGVEPWEMVYAVISGMATRTMVRALTRQYGPIYTLPREGGIIGKLMSWREHDGLATHVTPSAAMEMATELLLALAASHEATWDESASHQLVLRAQEVVRRHLSRQINASSLAADLGVSREHLTRIFRAHLGQTPWQYILRQQMQAACRLLTETTLSMREISERTGCSSQAIFTHRFKHTLGMTPSAFRDRGLQTPIFLQRLASGVNAPKAINRGAYS